MKKNILAATGCLLALAAGAVGYSAIADTSEKEKPVMKKTITELEKENAELKTTIETLSTGQKEIEKKLGLISSDWTPEQKQRIFGDKGNNPVNKVTAAADRRKEYEKK